MKIPGEWTFEKASVAASFDEHVREQLPWYDLATNAVAHVARHYIPRCGRVYDIGASTGNIGNAIVETLNERRAELIPVESSEEMAQAYAGPMKGNLIQSHALEVDYEPFDLAVCFLVLMFLTPADRAELLDRLRAKMRRGGAIVIFDKTATFGGYPGIIMWRLALAAKMASGATPEHILAKELSLRGVQRPLEHHEIPSDGVLWFRFGDFAGWLIEA